MTKVIEFWKDIKNYEGLYKISSLGRVISCKKEFNIRNRWGVNVLIKKEETFLKINNASRYSRCALCKDGSSIHYSVHRLVAMAFIDNPDNKPQVNHINGIKSDNNVVNLEWCTAKENSLHAYKNKLIDISKLGKHSIGVMPHNTRRVLDILTGKEYISMKQLEIEIGYTPNTLRAYLTGRYKDCIKGKKLLERYQVFG